MIAALLLACSEVLDRRLRRYLWRGLGLALALLLALTIVLSLAIGRIAVFGSALVNSVIEVAGGFLVLYLDWLLFPALATLALGFFLEPALALAESRHWPGLPPPRRQGWGEQASSFLRLAGLGLLLNLAALPLYLMLPGLSLIAFYALNGWLLGREYFELVALRRFAPSEVRAIRRTNGGSIFAGGLAIAGLMTVPVLNLAGPLIAALFMLHLAPRLRQREGAQLAIY